MSVFLSPIGNGIAFSDTSGNPRNGARIFTYNTGSSTKATTYTTSTGLTPNSNPITLNADGYSPQQIWLTGGMIYKFLLAPPGTDDPPSSSINSWDGISGINDASLNPASEWTSGPTPTYVSATQFTVAGDQRSTFEVNRRIKATVTAGTVYASISAVVFTTLTTITLYTSVLDSGLSAVSYGLLSATNPSISTGLWNTFTPTMTLVGGAGNTVPVYSTNTGRYTRVGNTIFVNVYLTGDGGAEGAGTGQINVALPVTVSASFPTTIYQAVGQAINGAANYLLVGILQASGTTIQVSFLNTTTALISAVTGADQNNVSRTLTLSFSYEA
jgi:hypothetical protein